MFSAKHPRLVMPSPRNSSSSDAPAPADEFELDKVEGAASALALVPPCGPHDQRNHPTLPPFTSRVLDQAQDAFKAEQLPDGRRKCSYAYHDALLSVGGLVWACEFMPQTKPRPADTRQVDPARSLDHETLAIAVHPAGSTRHKSGVVLSGQGAVQIWTIPNVLCRTSAAKGNSRGHQMKDSKHGGSRKQAGGKRAREEAEEEDTGPSRSSRDSEAPKEVGPSFAFCLGHHGLVTWDLKWCPDPSLIHTRPMRIIEADGARVVEIEGVLAFVSGDANVNILSVPSRNSVFDETEIEGSLCPATERDPQTLNVPAQFCISREMNGGSIACSLEWQRIQSHPNASTSASSSRTSPPPQGMLLLVGCCDGQVSGWKVPGPCQVDPTLQGLFQIKCDVCPIWSLSWCPPGQPYSGLEDVQGHTFATLSHSGLAKVWDIRDLSLPVHSHLMSRSPARGMVWTLAPLSLTSVHEDGVMRQLIMDPSFYGTVKDATVTNIFAPPSHSGCIWSICYHSPLSCALYCGEDGLAALMVVEAEYDSRKRLPHVAIGGFSGIKGGDQSEDVLTVLSPFEAAETSTSVLFTGGSYFGGSSEGKGKTKPSKHALPTHSSEAPVRPVLKTEAQSLYACHLSPEVSQGMVWTAYGGAAGLVRCQRVAIGIH